MAPCCPRTCADWGLRWAQVPILLWILAAVTMTLGNVLALLQDNVKRMLAYSSVAHAGYLLIGLASAPYLGTASGSGFAGGVDAVLFYLVAYGAMTIGAFAVIAVLSRPGRPVEKVDDLAGLGRSQPGVALVMTVFLFSLIGMPLTAGFIGKLMLFLGALAVPNEPAGQLRLFRMLAFIGGSTPRSERCTICASSRSCSSANRPGRWNGPAWPRRGSRFWSVPL